MVLMMMRMMIMMIMKIKRMRIRTNMMTITFDLSEEVIRTNYTQEVMLHIFGEAVDDDDDDDDADDGDEVGEEDEEQDK